MNPLADILQDWRQQRALKAANYQAMNTALSHLISSFGDGASTPTPETIDALRSLLLQQRARPWMSEFWTIFLAIPYVLAFLPWTTAYASQGFDALRHAPLWYVTAVAGAITLAFGIRVATVSLGNFFGAPRKAS